MNDQVRGSSINILVVDDKPDICEYLESTAKAPRRQANVFFLDSWRLGGSVFHPGLFR